MAEGGEGAVTRRGSLGVLYGTEMRMVLRDRRTVLATIVLPLLVMPAMLFFTHWEKTRREERSRDVVHLYAVDPSAVGARSWIDVTRARLDAPGGKGNPAGLKLREVEAQGGARSLERGDIHFYVREESGRSGAEAGSGGASGPAPSPVREEALPGVPHVVIVYRADRPSSARGAAAFREALAGTRRDHRQLLLSERGLQLKPSWPYRVAEADVSTEGEAAGLLLGRGLTALLLLVVLSAGAVVATDSLAGEKERGTLETVLTTAAGRGEIVAAKHLAILTVALAVTVLQTASFLVSVGFRLVPLPAGLAAAFPPSVAGLVLVLVLPVASLAAAALLLVSGFAASYREAQLAFVPLFLLGLVPALAPFLPGLPLRSAILVVPVANVAVAVKELLVGSRDWLSMGIAWLVTAAAALLVGRAAVRALSEERLVVPPARDGAQALAGPERFAAHLPRWFAVMWAAVLLSALNRGAGDARGELLFNLLVVFLAVPALILRAYRLDVREALALRMPRGAVWLAVAVGAPAGFLSGLAVYRCASALVPVPPALLERFGQALLPEGVPFWQTVLLLALLPAFSEEIVFRGLLLYGLRRLHPALLALTGAAVFALFHLSLFRLAPAAFVGLLLAALTLLTGSLFPAMAWHALNNACALLLARAGVSGLDLAPGLVAAGPPLLALAFWIVWRNRTPDPQLKPWRRPPEGKGRKA